MEKHVIYCTVMSLYKHRTESNEVTFINILYFVELEIIIMEYITIVICTNKNIL